MLFPQWLHHLHIPLPPALPRMSLSGPHVHHIYTARVEWSGTWLVWVPGFRGSPSTLVKSSHVSNVCVTRVGPAVSGGSCVTGSLPTMGEWGSPDLLTKPCTSGTLGMWFSNVLSEFWDSALLLGIISAHFTSFTERKLCTLQIPTHQPEPYTAIWGLSCTSE